MDLAGISVVDAHIHQWDPLGTPREFSTPAKLLRYLPLPVDFAARLTPKRDREFVGDPTAYLHPYLPADYRADAGAVPVEALVHIEVEWAGRAPGAKADETRWVASLPFGVDTPALGAIIGGGDPTRPGFADLVDAHRSASPLVRGIRTMVAHHPDPDVRSFAAAPGVLTSSGFLNGFVVLAERGLHFEAWVYSHQLPEVTALAQRYPEVTIVLNHLGTPAGIFGPVGRATGSGQNSRHELFARWREDLAALAAQPNVVAKVSGLAMPVLGHLVPVRGNPTPVAALLERVAPLLHHAFDVFGAQRLIWGSNFPVDKPITSIANSAQVVVDVLADRGGSAVELDQVFRTNAQQVYAIDADLLA
ncbi:amidohydrolase family protein [Nocardia sp. alder85J]|uniref:amidohydrolase family protein n=1 Tax=Nocardia sp. alder85J TaxID=2862949 RepID=UPI001CD33015|nr:amidohydrolase family protein [Nocardia sp. alder85J]MCX4097330.1 amidohydrolase family protein [Nocardia sp. alder85J]